MPNRPPKAWGGPGSGPKPSQALSVPAPHPPQPCDAEGETVQASWGLLLLWAPLQRKTKLLITAKKPRSVPLWLFQNVLKPANGLPGTRTVLFSPGFPVFPLPHAHPASRVHSTFPCFLRRFLDGRQPARSRESLARDYGVCGRLLMGGLWEPSVEDARPDPGEPCPVLTSQLRRPLCGDPHPPSPPSRGRRLCPGLPSCPFFLWRREGPTAGRGLGGSRGWRGSPAGEPRGSTHSSRSRVQGASVLAAGSLGYEEGRRIKLRVSKGGTQHQPTLGVLRPLRIATRP